MSASILDEKGNIIPKKIESELLKSLQSDVRYKQQDNMKKRACKVAKSYDEFRDMVSCAHLEHLRYNIFFLKASRTIGDSNSHFSRKEIESLSDKKKGWRKSGDAAYLKASILEKEKSAFESSARNSDSLLDAKEKNTLPRTVMEFNRDWKRLNSSMVSKQR